MEILKHIKDLIKSKEIDEDSAKEIIQTLDSEIEELKENEEKKEREQRDQESMDWANKVTEARSKNRGKATKTRKQLRHQKGISPARIVRLRQLGKID
ncbi:hypothetical protein OAJ85_00435 [Pseudomonadota bacterium]|nr:hypothetical protein [Pseudomonadota bacterium]